MSKRLSARILFSAIVLIGTSGLALADTIGRYECNIVGPIDLEPIGDRDGHVLRSLDYSCVGVDGLFKGGVFTGCLRQRDGWSEGDVSFSRRSSSSRWGIGSGPNIGGYWDCCHAGREAGPCYGFGYDDLQVRLGHTGCSLRKDFQMGV
jgi:hypothetical protein